MSLSAREQLEQLKRQREQRLLQLQRAHTTVPARQPEEGSTVCAARGKGKGKETPKRKSPINAFASPVTVRASGDRPLSVAELALPSHTKPSIGSIRDIEAQLSIWDIKKDFADDANCNSYTHISYTEPGLPPGAATTFPSAIDSPGFRLLDDDVADLRRRSEAAALRSSLLVSGGGSGSAAVDICRHPEPVLTPRGGGFDADGLLEPDDTSSCPSVSSRYSTVHNAGAAVGKLRVGKLIRPPAIDTTLGQRTIPTGNERYNIKKQKDIQPRTEALIHSWSNAAAEASPAKRLSPPKQTPFHRFSHKDRSQDINAEDAWRINESAAVGSMPPPPPYEGYVLLSLDDQLARLEGIWATTAERRIDAFLRKYSNAVS